MGGVIQMRQAKPFTIVETPTTGIRRYLAGRQPVHHFHSELHRIPIRTFTHPPSSNRVCLQKRRDPSGGPLWGGMRTRPKSMHLARAVAVCVRPGQAVTSRTPGPARLVTAEAGREGGVGLLVRGMGYM